MRGMTGSQTPRRPVTHCESPRQKSPRLEEIQGSRRGPQGQSAGQRWSKEGLSEDITEIECRPVDVGSVSQREGRDGVSVLSSKFGNLNAQFRKYQEMVQCQYMFHAGKQLRQGVQPIMRYQEHCQGWSQYCSVRLVCVARG